MRDLRMPVMILVEASWEDENGALQIVPARMEDKSAGGACIRIKTPIAVGSSLRIQWRFEQFSGTARYCRPDGRDYLVGIQRETGANAAPPVRQEAARQAASHSPSPPVAAVQAQIARSDPPPAEVRSAPAQLGKASPLLEVSKKPELWSGVASGNAPDTGPRGSSYGTDRWRRQRILRRPDSEALRRTELRTEQIPEPKELGGERKHMRRNWLDLGRHKQDEPSANRGKETSISGTPKEKPMSQSSLPTKKSPAEQHGSALQVALLPMEDIYHAAGIMIPRKGYSIKKVVEMLHSEHIANLAKDMKRVAVLMALDAAGVPLDEVLQDAKLRREALDSYESALRKQVEEEWARKAEENSQIQAELESVKAHYNARIRRNQEGMAREKDTFTGWLALKQEESQSIAEALEMCTKPKSSAVEQGKTASSAIAKPVSETEKDSIPEIGAANAAGAAAKS